MLIREGLKRAAPGVAEQVFGPACSTGYDVLSGADANGAVIDLQSPEWGGARYRAAAIAAVVRSTLGSTEADTRLSIGVRLQHGDSSGGGGMTDYSTAFIPADEVYGTTANSTAMNSWSTGLFMAVGTHNAFDLRAAKRYIRAVLKVTINDQSTTTAVAALPKTFKRGSAVVVLSAADQFPEGTARGPFTTATATST